MAAQIAGDPLEGHPKYQMVAPLSSGAFGVVHLYKNKKTNEHVAIKFLGRGGDVTKYYEFEILNHRILRHPHVVAFKEVFLTEDFICIVMEYASGGSLFKYVQKSGTLKESSARWFFQQLVLGVDYCHRKGVVNRDIKLENALLQKFDDIPLPLVKICDFGYSKSNRVSTPKSKVGTLAYMAPEVIRGGAYDGKLADIWSCGIMLYVMLFGQYPFHVDTAVPGEGNAQAKQRRVQEMMMKIMGMDYQIPGDVVVSPECKHFLQSLIVSDPAKRLTMAQIQQHPWFLANLPKEALVMNDQCLANTDYSDLQSVEEIQAILMTAQQTDVEGMIDEMIQEEVERPWSEDMFNERIQVEVSQG